MFSITLTAAAKGLNQDTNGKLANLLQDLQQLTEKSDHTNAVKHYVPITTHPMWHGANKQLTKMCNNKYSRTKQQLFLTKQVNNSYRNALSMATHVNINTSLEYVHYKSHLELWVLYMSYVDCHITSLL